MTVVRMSDEVNLTRQPWTSVSPALEDAEARQYRAPGLSRPGLAYRLSVQAPEDLISRALAGSQRTVHGRLMPVELGRFTSEEQRVIDRAGESRLRLDTADAYVAVGAAGKGIGCPVVRGAGDNLAIDLRTADAQRPPQRIQCAIQALPGGQACKRIGERAARPADQNRRVHRVAGPPPVEWLVGRDQKAELVRRQPLTAAFLEREDELDHVAHLEPTQRRVFLGEWRSELARERLSRRRLKHANRQRHPQ